MPTLRSEMTHRPQLFSSSGMTAQAASAHTAVTSGASRKTPLSAPAGITGSLSTNFRRSANDCSRPNGPTTLGPRRSCTAAQTLRSISSRKAMMISSPTSKARLRPTVAASHSADSQMFAVQSDIAPPHTSWNERRNVCAPVPLQFPAPPRRGRKVIPPPTTPSYSVPSARSSPPSRRRRARWGW